MFMIIITGTKLKSCRNAQILVMMRDIKRSRNSTYLTTILNLSKNTKTCKSLRMQPFFLKFPCIPDKKVIEQVTMIRKMFWMKKDMLNNLSFSFQIKLP